MGHSFSLLAQLPEKQASSSWLLPLDIKRVKTNEKGHEIGIAQMKEQLLEPSTPFYNKLCVLVADSLYNTKSNWQQTSQHDNLVFISRMRCNRNTYSPPAPNQARKKYGEKMKLNQPDTHRPSDEEVSFCRESVNGKKRYIRVKIWRNQLLRADRQFKGHEHPIILIQITVLNVETKKPLFKRPLWLSVHGEKGSEISIEAIVDSYFQRFDLEHFFRFGKNRLLMDKFQTPDIEHEINWWKIVQITYVQLFLSRQIAKSEPYPWERYLPTYSESQTNNEASPSQVQRYFGFILKQVGTPAKSVQYRVAGTGRPLGEMQKKREIHEIIFKKSQKKEIKKNTSEKPNDASKSSEDDKQEQISGFEKSLENLKTLNLKSMSSIVRNLLHLLNIDENHFAEKLADLVPI